MLWIALLNIAYDAAMELSALQIFFEVVRHGSFAAVARDRNIDPSSMIRMRSRKSATLSNR